MSSGSPRHARAARHRASVRLSILPAMNTTRPTMLLLGLLALTGCPEPVEVPASPDGSPGGGEAGAGGPGTGPATPGGNAPDQARWSVKAGEGVELSGTYAYEGSKTGKFRMDFRTVPEGSSPPALVHTLELSGPGEWKTRAPVDAGPIDIIAFIDVDGDGPTSGDPGGMTAEPVVVGSEDISGVVITVSDEADESIMNPRARWRGGEDGEGQPSGPATPEGGSPDGPPPDGPPPDGPPPDGPPPEGAPAGGEGGAEAPADG